MIFQRDPTLEELLREPIIQQMMLSDGVQPDDIRELARNVEEREPLKLSVPASALYPGFFASGCLGSAC